MKLKNSELMAILINPQGVAPIDTLSQQKLPVKVSLEIAKATLKIVEAYKPVETTRQALVKKYGEADEKGQTQIKEIIQDAEDKQKFSLNPAFINFQKEWQELMNMETDIDIKEKIKLPEKVAGTCDKCHHNMDVAFVIEPSVLMRLEKLIEV